MGTKYELLISLPSSEHFTLQTDADVYQYFISLFWIGPFSHDYLSFYWSPSSKLYCFRSNFT